MQEIILRILKMIEDGKVSADQAAELIRVIGSSGFAAYERNKAIKKKARDAAEKIKEKSGDAAESISKSVKNVKASIDERRAAAAALDEADEADDAADESLVDINTDEA